MAHQVLSLGAGIQSTTVLLMSEHGELPTLDAAIFADTGWESESVYTHLTWLEGHSRIPIYRVSGGNLRDDVLRGEDGGGCRYESLPFYVKNPDGSAGRTNRQCTRQYKVDPISRFIKTELLGLKKGQRAPLHAVDHWYGISADEPRRIRISRELWERNVYPLCNMPFQFLPEPMDRGECIDWLRRHYPGYVVPRSSCVGCPYRTNAEWRSVKRDPEVWAELVAFDSAIRHRGLSGELYLHRSLQPLDDIDLDSDIDMGQGMFGFSEECMGYCGN